MSVRVIAFYNETGQNYVFLHTVDRKKYVSYSNKFSKAEN